MGKNYDKSKKKIRSLFDKLNKAYMKFFDNKTV
jgi:hypothetical protein